METLFSKFVLNYDGAPLKDIKMSIVEREIDGRKRGVLKTSGLMNRGGWLRCEMI
jgi:hypothetical protein